MVKRCVAALSVVVACTFLTARPVVHAQSSGTDRYLVVFKADRVPSDIAARIAANGGTLVRAFGEIGVVSAAGDEAFAAGMANDSQVMAVGGEHVFGLPQTTAVEVQPDAAVEAGAPTSADSYYKPYQWDMRRIGAPEVWARLPVSANTARVAVLDVGVMDTHPDLAGQVEYSETTSYCGTIAPYSGGYPIYASYIDFDAHPVWSPADGCTSLSTPRFEWHGTHVAGTVAAKFGGGRAVGVAPDARVGAFKVFDLYQYKGAKAVGAFDGPIFTAIIEAAQRGYRVINMSLGSTALRNNKSDNASWLAWDRIAKWANRQGVVIVAAAGNSAFDLNGVIASVPSDLPTVVSVSASAASLLVTDANGVTNLAPGSPDLLASYSNFGASVNITAPGGDCGDAACSDGRYFILNDGIAASGAATYYLAAGTSMAAPHVSAVAAYASAIHPDWTPGQVRAWLESTAQPLGDRQAFGHGMVNANAAVR